MITLWSDLLGYLLLLVLNSFMCTGLYTSCDYELDVNTKQPTSRMMLWWVKYYGEKFFGRVAMKPICGCPTCMASLHAYPFWFFHSPSDVWHWFLFVMYVLCLAGLNTINARFT